MSLSSRFMSLLADVRHLDRGNIRIILDPTDTMEQRSTQVFWAAITIIFVYIYATYDWMSALMITAGIVLVVRVVVGIHSWL